jgi:hypothetical protein
MLHNSLHSDSPGFFQFEADFVDSLRCIPMQVRFKLDTCGIKLKLSHWHQFGQEERQALVKMPCSTQDEIQAYQGFLRQLVLEHTGSPAVDLPVEDDPAWMDETAIPASVQDKACENGITITPEQWTTLTILQRFVLLKLSRSGHENRNFLPALKEFGLA